MKIWKYKIVTLLALMTFASLFSAADTLSFDNGRCLVCQMGVTTQHTNEKCNGASTAAARANVSGGTAPYTYLWSPGGNTHDTATGLSAGTYTVTVTDHAGCTATATATITQPTAISISFPSYTDISCYGGSDGSVTASASGGTPGTTGYSYTWGTGITGATRTGLSAGTYTVTVTDANGCTATASITLTQPSALTASITSHNDISCHGGSDGSATVTAGGGTTAYTYSWSPSGGTNATASSLTAGTYTVTVTDAHGCTATASITLTQPAAALSVSITTHNDISCHGGSDGSATAGASGGTASYTYSWSPSGGTSTTASNLTAGSYTVTATDAHGCTATASITLTQPETALSASITDTTMVSCHGGNNGSATVGVSGGTPSYTYSWSPSGGTNATASDLTAGTYTVTVTDSHGCTVTASITIIQPEVSLSIIKTDSTNVSCHGGSDGSATVSGEGGTPSYTYSWSPGGGTNATASDLTAGTYTVTITDAHGCTATASFTITQPTESLVAYIEDSTNINCHGGENGSATVSAGGGTPSYAYSWSPGGGTGATASSLTAGSYTVTVTDAHGCTVTVSVNLTEPYALATGFESTNVSCHGGSDGSATAAPSGGTPSYTYSWSPGGATSATISSLTAGTYSVTVTDSHGCTVTASVIITEPVTPLSASVNIVDAGCTDDNGTATASAIGGTLAYTYSWSTGATTSSITGMSAGTYTVTVTDAHGCTATASGTIVIANDLSAAVTTIPACGDGSTGKATVTAFEGTTPYTYSWSPSGGTNPAATGLSAGTYTVTVTDAAGCSVTASVTVAEDTTPVVTITPSPRTIEYLQYSTLTASTSYGTPPYTYSWSGPDLSGSSGNPVMAAPPTTSIYTVTVTDASGCSGTDTVTIFVNPPSVETPTSCDTCIGGLNLIPGKKYVISVWAKESSASAGTITYTNPQVEVVFPPGDSTGPFSPQGNIIDGWQRIEGEFTVPATATVFQIKLSSLSGDCNFDDIRVFPFNGTLKTYVYDPNTLRLAVVLDERNYATIYEYDEEGKLIRVKKETERGIMTIQESRTAMKKQ